MGTKSTAPVTSPSGQTLTPSEQDDLRAARLLHLKALERKFGPGF